MKKIFAFLFLIAMPVASHGASAPDVREAHLRNCLANGGAQNVCACSYDKALDIMTLDELASINMQLEGKITDSTLAAKFEKVTAECAIEARNSIGRIDGGLLPPPPPPPPLPTLEPLPEKETLGNAKTYIGDMSSQPAGAGIDADEKAPSKEMIERKIAENEVETYDNGAYAEPAKPKRPAGYFGEYDKRFFDAIATGDTVAIRAYSTRVYDYDVRNQDGDTSLIVAIVNGQAPSVSFLLDRGAKVNAKNTRGQAPIHIASYIKRPDIVELLINANADVNMAYGVGYTPLSLAIMQQDTTTVDLLLKAKARVGKALADGNTELHIAAAATNPEIIQLLVSNGAKVNQRNKEGYTPLMVAAYTGNAAVAEKLVTLGADVNLKDPAGRTALTLAHSAGKTDTVNVLMVYQR